MNVRLVDGPMPTSPALLARVGAKVSRAVGRFGDRIGEVVVRIRDLNADKGGIDKQCLIVAKVPGGRPVVVEERQPGYHAAVYGAITKLKTAVTRRMQRR